MAVPVAVLLGGAAKAAKAITVGTRVAFSGGLRRVYPYAGAAGRREIKQNIGRQYTRVHARNVDNITKLANENVAARYVSWHDRHVEMGQTIGVSVFRSVAGRNVRKLIFQDLPRGGGLRAVGRAGIDSFKFSAELTKKIDIQERIKGFATTTPIRRITTSKQAKAYRKAKADYGVRKAFEIDKVRKARAARQSFPTLNFKTGEIEASRTAAIQMQDIALRARGIMLDPVTRGEKFTRAFVVGAAQQGIQTTLDREVIGSDLASDVLWSSAEYRNVTRWALPSTRANSAFAKSTLAVRSFDALTAYDTEYGSVKRLRRVETGVNVVKRVRNGVAPSAIAASYITPQGLGRFAGALAARELMLARGEEEKRRQKYIEQYQ